MTHKPSPRQLYLERVERAKQKWLAAMKAAEDFETTAQDTRRELYQKQISRPDIKSALYRLQKRRQSTWERTMKRCYGREERALDSTLASPLWKYTFVHEDDGKGLLQVADLIRRLLNPCEQRASAAYKRATQTIDSQINSLETQQRTIEKSVQESLNPGDEMINATVKMAVERACQVLEQEVHSARNEYLATTKLARCLRSKR